MRYFSLILVLGLGCAGQPAVPGPTAPVAPESSAPAFSGVPATSGLSVRVQTMTGTWKIADSSARFRIWFEHDRPMVEGWDENDGEKFEILDAHLEGETLWISTRMPSTDYRLTTKLTLEDPDHLHAVRLNKSLGAQQTSTFIRVP